MPLTYTGKKGQRIDTHSDGRRQKVQRYNCVVIDTSVLIASWAGVTKATAMDTWLDWPHCHRVTGSIITQMLLYSLITQTHVSVNEIIS